MIQRNRKITASSQVENVKHQEAWIYNYWCLEKNVNFFLLFRSMYLRSFSLKLLLLWLFSRCIVLETNSTLEYLENLHSVSISGRLLLQLAVSSKILLEPNRASRVGRNQLWTWIQLGLYTLISISTSRHGMKLQFVPFIFLVK